MNVKAWFEGLPVGVRIGLVAGVAVGLVLAGAGLCRGLYPRVETREVVHNQIVYQDRWQLETRVVQGETKYVTREVTRFVFGENGKPTEETITHEASSDHVTTDTRTAAGGESTGSSTTDTSRTVTAMPDPRFLLTVGLGVSPLRGSSVSGMVSLAARVLGPVYLGAFVYVPSAEPAATAVGLTVGMRF